MGYIMNNNLICDAILKLANPNCKLHQLRNIITYFYWKILAKHRSTMKKQNKHATSRVFKMCGYEVPGMILLRDLKVAVQLDHSKDMSMHVSTCTN
jgi:hypothetical protein